MSKFDVHEQAIVDIYNQNVWAREILVRDAFDKTSAAYKALLNDSNYSIVDVDLSALVGAAYTSLRTNSSVAINISNETMASDKNFGTWCKSFGLQEEVAKQRIIIEITEEIEEKYLIERFKTLKGMGVYLALDDFGDKHSTPARLANYDWDIFKIDVRLLNTMKARQAVNYCNYNKILMVAERIETVEEALFAESVGITLLQGYYFHVPEPQADLCFIKDRCSKFAVESELNVKVLERHSHAINL